MDVNIDLCTIFNSMSEEKQKEIAAKLVHDQLYSTKVRTIIINPEDDDEDDDEFDSEDKMKARSLDMRALVNDIGEEEAIELMLSMLKAGIVTTKILDAESIDKLMKKCEAGDASEEEYAMANCVIQSALQQASDSVDISIMITKTLLDLIAFYQEENHMKMDYYDVLSAIFMLIIGSMVNTPNTPMERFKDSGPQQCVNVADTISKDIENCLKSNIFKEKMPNDQFMILGLLHLAQKYACKLAHEEPNTGVFADPKVLENMFGLTEIFKDIEKDEDEN